MLADCGERIGRSVFHRFCARIASSSAEISSRTLVKLIPHDGPGPGHLPSQLEMPGSSLRYIGRNDVT